MSGETEESGLASDDDVMALVRELRNEDEIKRIFDKKFPKRLAALDKFLSIALLTLELVPIPTNENMSESQIRDADSELREYNTTLGRINNNLNQIAKRMNATGNVYSADIKEVKELIKKVWDT